jgi:hypothetical protein
MHGKPLQRSFTYTADFAHAPTAADNLHPAVESGCHCFAEIFVSPFSRPPYAMPRGRPNDRLSIAPISGSEIETNKICIHQKAKVFLLGSFRQPCPNSIRQSRGHQAHTPCAQVLLVPKKRLQLHYVIAYCSKPFLKELFLPDFPCLARIPTSIDRFKEGSVRLPLLPDAKRPPSSHSQLCPKEPSCDFGILPALIIKATHRSPIPRSYPKKLVPGIQKNLHHPVNVLSFTLIPRSKDA